MSNNSTRETFVEQRVTYTLETQGKLIIIEDVPARVCVETGERLFSPDTVERLHGIAWGERSPLRVIEAPVYDFAQ